MGIRQALTTAVAALAACGGCRGMSRGTLMVCVPVPNGFERRLPGPFTTQIGREVSFQFSVSDPLVDYAVIKIGRQAVNVVAGPEAPGRFRFKHVFTEPTPPEGVELSAQAYIPRGTTRDWVPDQTGWVQEISPFDTADIADGKARIVIHVLDAKAVFHLPADKQYAWSSARMKIYGKDPQPKFVAQGTPELDGFAVKGPADGRWTIEYRPDPAILRPAGATRVEFTLTNKTDDVFVTLETWIGGPVGNTP